MSKKRSRGFTLIELIAVLVIMSIIALIVTPLVLNVVRKAKDSANKRSVDAYGKSIDLAVASYLLDTKEFPTSFSELTIEYTGKEVVCGIEQLNEDSSVYLSECTVGNSEVKDSSTDDGWYHYGKEIKIYDDYKVGDCIEDNTYINYNDEKWCVIENSDKYQDYVTVMKYIPLDYNDVWNYGKDENGNFTLNKYGPIHGDWEGKYSYNNKIYSLGLVRYNDSATCGFLKGGDVSSLVENSCNNQYNNSKIQFLLNNYKNDKLNNLDLKEVNGNEIRLITVSELHNNLFFESNKITEKTPLWVYEGASYWTMTPVEKSDNSVYIVDHESIVDVPIYGGTYYYRYGYARPVVTILKSAI